MSIRALVFDFDGLILDTEGPDLVAWQDVFAQHGVALPIDLWCQYVGTAADAFDICAHLEELAGCSVVREEVRQRHRVRCDELILLERPRPGVMEWLDDAARLELGLAVASSSRRPWVEGHLRTHGLLERFACVICRDETLRGKPAPDVYLEAVRRLGVAPAEAIAVEDSPNGVTAAKAAGLYCVAVPNVVTRPLRFEHADLVLDSFEDLSLEALLARFAPPRGA